MRGLSCLLSWAVSMAVGAAAAAPPPAATKGVRHLVSTTTGASLLYAVPAPGDQADLFAQRINEQGQAVGQPLLLGRGSGPVQELAGASLGDGLWVAWLSRRPETEAPGASKGGPLIRYLVSALHIDIPSGRADAPLVLEEFRVRKKDPVSAGLLVGAKEDGGAMVVAPGRPSRCGPNDTHDSNWESRPCPSVLQIEVSREGKLGPRRSRANLTKELPSSMVPIPGGAVYLDAAWGIAGTRLPKAVQGRSSATPRPWSPR